MLSIFLQKRKKLEEKITEGRKVVIFYAKGCPACKTYMRILLPDIVGRLFRYDIEVLKLENAKHRQLFSETSSETIPTTSIYLDGKLLDSKTGSMSYRVAVPWILETYGIDPHKAHKKNTLNRPGTLSR